MNVSHGGADPAGRWTEVMTCDELNAKWERKKEHAPKPTAVRIRRALSWLCRAESELENDPDAAFIFHWIAFNACYAKDGPKAPGSSERDSFADYFRAILKLDNDQTVFDAIWKRFPHEIRMLLGNRYVFQPFWNNQAGRGHDNWLSLFEQDDRNVYTALSNRHTQVILEVLFDRLYTLRIQLMHGGATWKHGRGRTQVQDGSRIVALVIPLFIELMIDNPKESWGPLEYPPVP